MVESRTRPSGSAPQSLSPERLGVPHGPMTAVVRAHGDISDPRHYPPVGPSARRANKRASVVRKCSIHAAMIAARS